MQFVNFFWPPRLSLCPLFISIAIITLSLSCKPDNNSFANSDEISKQTFPIQELRQGLWPSEGLNSWERRVLFGDVLIVIGRIAVKPELSGPFDFREINELKSKVHVRHCKLLATKVLYCDPHALIDGRLAAIQGEPVEFPCFSKVQMAENSTIAVEITLQELKEGEKGVFVIAFDEFLVSYELIKVVDEASKKRLVQLLEQKVENHQRWNLKVSKFDFSDLR